MSDDIRNRGEPNRSGIGIEQEPHSFSQEHRVKIQRQALAELESVFPLWPTPLRNPGACTLTLVGRNRGARLAQIQQELAGMAEIVAFLERRVRDSGKLIKYYPQS